MYEEAMYEKQSGYKERDVYQEKPMYDQIQQQKQSVCACTPTFHPSPGVPGDRHSVDTLVRMHGTVFVATKADMLNNLGTNARSGIRTCVEGGSRRRRRQGHRRDQDLHQQ